MWCRTDNQKCRNNRNGENKNPVRDIKCPSLVAAEWLEEILLLDETERSQRKFNVCGPTPDGRYNCKNDEALDIPSKSQGVV